MTFKNHFKGYRVVYSQHALKCLGKLSRHIETKIREKFELLSENGDSNQIVRVKGFKEPLFRLRIADFRAVFEVHHGQITILVIKIDHRKDVYNDY